MSSRIYREYKLDPAKIEIDGDRYEGNGRGTLMTTGEIILSVDILGHHRELWKKPLNSITIVSGITENGLKLKPVEATLARKNLQGLRSPVVTLTAFPSTAEYDLIGNPSAQCDYSLTNFYFTGTEVEDRINQRILSLMPLSLPEAQETLCRFLGNYGRSDAEEFKKTDVTAMLEIPTGNAPPRDMMISNLCVLMSFATGTWVNWICRDEKDESGQRLRESWQFRLTRSVYRGQELIPENEPGAPHLKRFLEMCLPNSDTAEEYGFFTAVQHYLESKRQILEAHKFLFACNAMETLKNRYSVIHNRNGSFFELCKGLFNEFGYPNEEFPFINPWRNNVIHEGVTNMPDGSFYDYYHPLLEQLDRILLKIIGYSGRYFDISNGYEIKNI